MLFNNSSTFYKRIHFSLHTTISYHVNKGTSDGKIIKVRLRHTQMVVLNENTELRLLYHE